MGATAAALAAFLVAIPLMRLSGLAASLGTFAFLNIVYVVASNWSSVSGGSTGLANVPQTTTRFTGVLWVAVVIFLAWCVQLTRQCLRLRASREDEAAAASVGLASITSGSSPSCSAGSSPGSADRCSPSTTALLTDAFFVTITFLTVAMLVVGGRLSLSGAVVGTVFITAVTEGLRRIEGGVDLALFLDPRAAGASGGRGRADDAGRPAAPARGHHRRQRDEPSAVAARALRTRCDGRRGMTRVKHLRAEGAPSTSPA